MTASLHSRSSLKPILFLLSLLLLPASAYAHVGAGETSGWVHGMLHPLMGIDHLCAMIAAGLWATQMGGRAMLFVPLTFVSVMVLGGLLGMAAIPLPFIETGILMSLLVLGVLIAAAVRLPLLASAVIVGIFALFHGYAHGAEMPHNTSGLGYALGFMFVSAALHATGIGMALGLNKLNRPQWLRFAGASIALFGGTLYFAG
jgi:urease accessory protein